MNKLIYNINERPRTIKELLIYALQQVLAVFVATVLIANICGTPVSSCLLGACIATILYQLITRNKSPMFISSCGATVSAVIGALTIGTTKNYFAVVLGGLVIFIVYATFALLVKLKGIDSINKIFPAIIVGPITMVIGINLAGFIPTYTALNGEHSNVSILVAVVTMFTVAISSHYFKGFWKTIPFLIGLGVGYLVAVGLTLLNVAPLVDFSLFKEMKIFEIPDFTFKYWSFSFTFEQLIQIIVLFVPVSICSLLEHYSDHKVLSNIIGTDLTETPGLHRTLLGDGFASLIGTVLCGLPNTSYGESIATTGFSRVASVTVIRTAAIILGILSFLYPVQILIASIPACVFGGCAMILYGYIACSGLRTLYAAKPDLNNNKNLIIISVILTVGVSGIYLFNTAFAGVSLAIVLGIALNLILKEKR